MRVAFLPDGGPAAGLGHLSRCLAVAQALEYACGIQPKFVVVDRNSQAWLAERGMQVLDDFNGNWDVMIVDSYVQLPVELDVLQAHAKVLAVFDDKGEPPRDVHWIINTGIKAVDVSYSHACAQGLLLGPTFHPLRSEYWMSQPDAPVSSVVRNILVTVGGGSQLRTVERILVELRKVLPTGCFHILLGPHADLKSQLTDGSNVFIHRSPLNVREVLAMADIAISAGGQTLFELAYLGVPTIAMEIACNQRANIRGFSESGAVMSVGDITQPEWKEQLTQAFSCLLNEPDRRQGISEAGRQLVDGKGALRLAKLLTA